MWTERGDGLISHVRRGRRGIGEPSASRVHTCALRAGRRAPAPGFAPRTGVLCLRRISNLSLGGADGSGCGWACGRAAPVLSRALSDTSDIRRRPHPSLELARPAPTPDFHGLFA
jgi:hypothetical protein